MAQVQILYAATADGIVQLANPGNSDRWRVVDQALGGHDGVAVRASLADALLAVAGTTSGLYATHDGGASWQPAGATRATALAASADGRFYAGTADGQILSSEDAMTWTMSHTGRSAVRHLAVLADGRVSAAYRDGEVVSLLEDGTWKTQDVCVPGVAELVSSAADPHELFFTNTKGLVTHWGIRPVMQGPTGALVLLAGKPEVLLLGTVDGLQRTEDGGATLVTVENGPRNAQVLVNPPRFQDWAYAGTGLGELWLSKDRGRTWTKLRDGLPPVRDLSFARVQ
jgi:hypothetical protein